MVCSGMIVLLPPGFDISAANTLVSGEFLQWMKGAKSQQC